MYVYQYVYIPFIGIHTSCMGRYMYVAYRDVLSLLCIQDVWVGKSRLVAESICMWHAWMY